MRCSIFVVIVLEGHHNRSKLPRCLMLRQMVTLKEKASSDASCGGEKGVACLPFEFFFIEVKCIRKRTL